MLIPKAELGVPADGVSKPQFCLSGGHVSTYQAGDRPSKLVLLWIKQVLGFQFLLNFFFFCVVRKDPHFHNLYLQKLKLEVPSAMYIYGIFVLKCSVS